MFLFDREPIRGGLELTWGSLNRIRDMVPDAYAGVNFRALPGPLLPYKHIDVALLRGTISDAPDAVWVDDVSTPVPGYETIQLELLHATREKSVELKSIQLLGGAAAGPLDKCGPLVDVVTVGSADARQANAPAPQELEVMQRSFPDKPLAMVGGIRETAFASYAGIVSKVLVAAEVETEPFSGILDDRKLRRLVSLAHEL